MNFIADLLTFVLVINCLLLIFLVLVQLPKKDAGAGMAFGAGAADALFGAGSGNALTKITKYAAGALIVLCLMINYASAKSGHDNGANFQKKLQQKQMESTAPSAPAPSMTPAPTATPTTTPVVTSTNAK